MRARVDALSIACSEVLKSPGSVVILCMRPPENVWSVEVCMDEDGQLGGGVPRERRRASTERQRERVRRVQNLPEVL